MNAPAAAFGFSSAAPPNGGDGSDDSSDGGRGKRKRSEEFQEHVKYSEEEDEEEEEGGHDDKEETTRSASGDIKSAKEQRRLEVNKLKARERRKCKKRMWEDMQKRILQLGRENIELRQKNELLATELSIALRARGDAQPGTNPNRGATALAAQQQLDALAQLQASVQPVVIQHRYPRSNLGAADVQPLTSGRSDGITLQLSTANTPMRPVAANVASSQELALGSNLDAGRQGLGVAMEAAQQIPAVPLQLSASSLADNIAAVSGITLHRPRASGQNVQDVLTNTLLGGQQLAAAHGSTSHLLDGRTLQLLGSALHPQQHPPSVQQVLLNLRSGDNQEAKTDRDPTTRES